MKAERFSWIKKLMALHKVGLCLAIALLVFFIIPWDMVDVLSHVMIGWLTFSLAILTIDWLVFYTTPSKQIRKQAQVQDGSRFIIFAIVLVATLASLLAVGSLLIQEKDSHKLLHIFVAVPSMLLSWSLVHTIFTVRYAHLYYGDHKEKENTPARGLDFPDEESTPNDNPDFIDFAYFSFIIGMTFQVSDVQVTSRRLRRLVLMHSLIAFGYNTVLVALTINTLAGLRSS
ncbi:DUF1345 domain-containing protein [Panacibacter ginsenosidivorans]|uniref:DUF1345 domain-containing protein n=1 Tax=Panacibacter ginsenosidivorans TaxID=1813871 RepID=A0A5B8VBM6_9BACT|nr:DUF1345 domain-containing protein [Panacibacter ginsenosidivorans]QEC68425.1 DUF1345 domain-containing protein [Panacibacter ginsenosidivorans]